MVIPCWMDRPFCSAHFDRVFGSALRVGLCTATFAVRIIKYSLSFLCIKLRQARQDTLQVNLITWHKRSLRLRDLGIEIGWLVGGSPIASSEFSLSYSISNSTSLTSQAKATLVRSILPLLLLALLTFKKSFSTVYKQGSEEKR